MKISPISTFVFFWIEQALNLHQSKVNKFYLIFYYRLSGKKNDLGLLISLVIFLSFSLFHYHFTHIFFFVSFPLLNLILIPFFHFSVIIYICRQPIWTYPLSLIFSKEVFHFFILKNFFISGSSVSYGRCSIVICFILSVFSSISSFLKFCTPSLWHIFHYKYFFKKSFWYKQLVFLNI